MKTALLGAAFLLASTLAASAETVTYVFRAFVEHYPGGGSTRPAQYGTVVPFRITVNTSAPGTVSGNTEIYSASSGTDPIVSSQFGHTTIPPSYNDSISVTKNPDGSSAITIFSYAVQVGAYTVSFVSSHGDAVKSLSIPTRILTLHFDNATFTSNYPGAVAGGNLVTAGIPPAS